MDDANNQVLAWYKCLRKRTKLKINCTRCAVYLSAPSFWLYQVSDRPDSLFFPQQNKANQNRTQISSAHIPLQTALTFYLLGGSCWTSINTRCTAVQGCLWLFEQTLQSSWFTVRQFTYITEVMKRIPNLIIVLLVYPCSIEIISPLYQNDSRSSPSISCPCYSFDLRAELKRHGLKAL